MKKLICLCLLLTLPACATAPQTAEPSAATTADGIAAVDPNSGGGDWKTEILDIMESSLQNMSDKMGVGKAVGRVSVAGGMIGICAGFAVNTQNAAPDSAIKLATQLQTTMLRGDTPSVKDIRNMGLECMNFIEATLKKQGLTDQEIRQSVAPAMKVQLKALFRQLGK